MEEPVLINEDVLAEAFTPTRLLHREGQLKELERCLQPALEGRHIENVFLTGKTGTGKTVVSKWILENYFEDQAVYVNCWENETTHQVLTRVLLHFGIPVHGRESNSELISKLDILIQKRRLIVCLDEVDRLREFDVLYSLARRECGLILVSNNAYGLIILDSRIRSGLDTTKIEFPTYKPQEIFDILKDRTEFAIRPGSVDDDLLGVVATLAKGDVRVALRTLERSAREADRRYSDEISLADVDKAAAEARRFKKSYLLSKLNDHEKLILCILQENHNMSSGQLYREYCRASDQPHVDRAYRNSIRKIVELGLAIPSGQGRWKKYEAVL